MVLELKEYTMASLGCKLSITHPINTKPNTPSPSFSIFSSFLTSLSLCRSLRPHSQSPSVLYARRPPREPTATAAPSTNTFSSLPSFFFPSKPSLPSTSLRLSLLPVFLRRAPDSEARQEGRRLVWVHRQA